MSASLCLKIGPLRLAARRDGFSPLSAPAVNEFHRRFLVEANAVPSDTDIVVSCGTPPEPGGTILYRHRSPWAMRKAERGWRMDLVYPPRAPRWRRSALATADFSRIRLSIGPDDESPADPFAYLLPEILTIGLAARRSGLLVHAAAAAFGGRGILALGASGAGKSTLTGILAAKPGWMALGDESHLVAADSGGAFRVHGTPWPGSSGLCVPGAAPLAMVLFLEHAPESRLTPVRGAAALAELLSHSFLPVWDRDGVVAETETAARIIEAAPAFRFGFRPDGSAADALQAALETV